MVVPLVAIPEIATMLGVSRQRASKIIHSYENFPEPVAELSIGRIWKRSDVQRWINTNPRLPGRPIGSALRGTRPVEE